MSEPLPCPFCGGTEFAYYANQGDKWGRVMCWNCSAAGPEVRTSYNVKDDAPWHADADEEWNNRA